MIDVKLKLQPGHTADLDWMAPSPLWQLFWNVTYACNFRCTICFSSAGKPASDELTTEEAKRMIRDAHAAGITDIVISGGEPFARPDLLELLAVMGALGISARIATNGTLLTEDLLRRVRNETLTKSFQVSLDTLDHPLYARIHGCRSEALDKALASLRWIRKLGFHTTVSTRLSPWTLPGIPALLDRAVQEDWATVTVHCPLHTGRAHGAWPQDADVFSLLQGVFEHFLTLPRSWLVEMNVPWAPFHPVVQRLSEQIHVAHTGCGAGRCRLAVGASGWISPCICIDLPAGRMGNVRTQTLAEVFRQSPIADLMQHPEKHGICVDCPHVARCGGGCRAAAYALTGRLEGPDGSCPMRQAEMRARGSDPFTSTSLMTSRAWDNRGPTVRVPV